MTPPIAPGGCTAWGNYQVPQLAGFVGDDLTEAWQLSRAWQQTYELVGSHRSALQQIRDRIEAAWPPAENSAAAAFVSVLDGLVASMVETQDAAAGIHEATVGLLSTLDDARIAVERMHREWVRKQGAAVLSVEGVSDLFVDWQGELNQRAQKVMYETDAAVYAYTRRLVPPTPYVLPTSQGGDEDQIITGGGSDRAQSRSSLSGSDVAAGFKKVVIPPLPPLAVADGSQTQTDNGSATPQLLQLAAASPSSTAGQVSNGASLVPSVGAATGVLPPPSGSKVSYSRTLNELSPEANQEARRVVQENASASDRSLGAVGASSSGELQMEPGFMGGAGAGGRQRTHTRRALRSAERWEIPEGGPGVLKPSSNSEKHSPGPGVIGLDV
jgi:hypothetical protein